jgi:hypothetical protein
VAIIFRQSAGRHGISSERAMFVIATCPSPLYTPDDAAAGVDTVLFLGPDPGGVRRDPRDADAATIRARVPAGDAMAVTTKHGRVLTDEDLDRVANEAERGYDLERWRPRRGRPFLDPATGATSPRVSVRVPASLRDRATARAASEGRSISDVLRGLLEDYASGPVDARTRLPR